MDQLPFSPVLIKRALDRLAANPWIYPALVAQAVVNNGGIRLYIAQRVPDGDPLRVQEELAFVAVSCELCEQGLGWVSYTPPAVATTTA
jgi:hypothetical protein